MIRPIVAVRIKNNDNGKNKTIYAMLDSGADTDFIDEKVITELGIDTWKKK